MQVLAQQFLDAYARGEMVPGGWLFPKALQQSRLDYSDDSLTRIDHLLDSIRTRVKPSRELLIDSEAGRNFFSLLAFYVVELVARRTQTPIEWYPCEAAPQILRNGQALADQPINRLFCRVKYLDLFFFPLGWIESRLLGDDTPMPAAQYLDRMVQGIGRAGSVHWWEAMHALGRLASWQMNMARGGAVLPKMLSSAWPNTYIALGMPGITGDLDESVQQGASKLESNPDGALWQVMSYDGWLDGPDGNQDAVFVVVQTYGESPLAVKMAFPYRPPTADRPLSILQPQLKAANQPDETLRQLERALWCGVYSVTWPDGASWDGHRDPSTFEVEGARQASLPKISTVTIAAPTAEEVERERALHKLRASFEQRQQRMSELSLASILSPKPAWMGPSDGLNEVYRQQRLLLTEGQVVWGALVMANSMLFEPGKEDLPAVVVHSTDPHFDSYPMALCQIAQDLFALKNKTVKEPTLQRLADFVTDERGRDMGLSLSPGLTSRPVFAGTFMVIRNHVPAGFLRGRLIPVLTHPATPAVMMLPFEYWPIELIILWKEGRL